MRKAKSYRGTKLCLPVVMLNWFWNPLQPLPEPKKSVTRFLGGIMHLIIVIKS